MIQEQGTGESLVDEKQMDLHDLLKSFEEHSLYKKQVEGGQPSGGKKEKQLTM